MDIEELKKALKTEEGKAIIDEMVESATKGLKAKRDELLSDMKELKERLKGIEAEKADAEEKAAAKTGDVNKVKEQLEAKHKKEIDALTQTKVKLESQLQSHVIGEGLTQALVKAKIAPALMEAAKALIKTNFKGEIGDNDGKPFAKFDGKAVDEFVTEWAQSDAGKHFVTADGNTGGGSNGTNGNGKAGTGTKSMTRSEFESLQPLEKVAKAKEGVTLTD